MEEKFADYGEVQIKQLNDRSKMYYTPNKENNVFQLVVQYGAGEREFPKLGYAAQLMNNAGIMGGLRTARVERRTQQAERNLPRDSR